MRGRRRWGPEGGWFTPKERRVLAFAALMGGCVTMTAYAFISLYLVRTEAKWVFWLGIAAHAQIALGMGVFAAHFVRRTVKVGKDGIMITDDEYVEITDKPLGGTDRRRADVYTSNQSGGDDDRQEQDDQRSKGGDISIGN